MTMHGKSVLITGGNSGIGLATARLMLAQGARVAITGRDQGKLDAAVAELKHDVLGIRADLTRVEDIQALVAQLGGTFDRLDVVFANAGISGPTPLGSTTLQDFELILRTNLTSVFFTLQAVLPLMSEGSAIVFNGSVMRELGSPGSAAYSATKAGISGMAKVFAAELAPRGIRVNTVIPGATRTPIWTRDSRSAGSMEATEAYLAPRIPLGRLAEPEETANAVLFLATAPGITGAEVVVDGGATGAPYGGPIFRQA